MLSVARQRADASTNVDWRLGGLEELPLQDQEIDAALCVLVLHHVPDLNAAMREIQRTLKPEGRCVIVDLLPHDRASYQESMGHQHLGFDQAQLQALAEPYGLRLTGWRALPHSAKAQGPQLFVCILHK